MADSEARASVFMNRRIRNRTSGGVGGRRGWKHPRLLPDGQSQNPDRPQFEVKALAWRARRVWTDPHTSSHRRKMPGSAMW